MKKLINLQLFNDVEPINVTTQPSLSPTMKTFYDTTLLENAKEEMVFDQLAEHQPMKGNKVEWRKFNTFKKAMTPLTEGVIPTGQTFGMTKIEADTEQYGTYTALSDRVLLETYDDVLFGATEEMGTSQGETYDTLTRNKIIGGNSVAYCPDISGEAEVKIESRKDLTVGSILTPAVINKAATWLKKNKAPKYQGYYACFIHPSVAMDFKETDEYKEYHKYNAVEPIFKGELGEMHGVRFIESTNCKVHAPKEIADGINRLTLKNAVTSATSAVYVKEKLKAQTPESPIEIYVNGVENTITAITVDETGTKLTLGSSVSSLSAGAMICGQGAGKLGNCTYDTLFVGAKAYAVAEPDGEGMGVIVKTPEQVGGPLNQFGTVGYKFCHAAEILYQERVLRVESSSKTFGFIDEEN